MGPTASGKTALAMALADRFPLELISVDSAQVFRDMDIGTAKPDSDTLARYPHRLINLISPEESYSAARFRADALTAMQDITAAGKVPLLVGGTMLYFRALLQGLAELPKADAALRAEIDAEAAADGWPAMHARLATLDPTTAARLHPTDSQRIQRALEVMAITGKPLSAQQGGLPSPFGYRVLKLALIPGDRAVLHKKFNGQVAKADGTFDKLNWQTLYFCRRVGPRWNGMAAATASSAHSSRLNCAVRSPRP